MGAVAGIAAAFGLHVVVMHVPWGQQLLGTGPLPLQQWLVELALSLSVLLAVELQKALQRHADRGSSPVGRPPGC